MKHTISIGKLDAYGHAPVTVSYDGKVIESNLTLKDFRSEGGGVTIIVADEDGDEIYEYGSHSIPGAQKLLASALAGGSAELGTPAC